MTSLVPHVLIVDDDQTFARTLCRLLTENGYDAASLSSGTALTEYLLTQPVDLLLLDLSLPGRDGFSILETIRRDNVYRNLPVLALSPAGSLPPGTAVPGASELIAKPVQVRQLLTKIRAHLRAGRTLNRSRAEARSQAALMELLREITSDLPIRELFQVLVRQVATALRIPRCSILFGKPGAERVTVAAASENPMLSDLAVDLRRYPEIQKALTTGEVVLVRDAPTDPLYHGMTSIDTTSTLVLPFSLGGERAGVFFLRTGAGDPPLGDTDLRFAARVVDSAVSAIEKALEREESVRRDEGLRQLAETDPLTGLLNREGFDRRLREKLERAGPSGKPLTCMLIHLGDLKRLPITHGGRSGDRVLTQFAELLRREQRAVDVLARYGEEDFVMLLPDTRGTGARLFAERILQHAGRTAFGEPDQPITVPVSLGLATYPGEKVTDAGSLLERAGQNLLRARSDGRNSYRD
jgi:two-component system cell cycle response regulator